MIEEIDYWRIRFGLTNPGKDEKVKIGYMAGLDYYITWVDCPDGENILCGHFKKKQDLINIIEENKWILFKNESEAKK